ncbi:hypothetical protein [Cerasicoccus fimbriatus]|uniref:hypothetical protein n=1 Tax=Cerasicoccus fimbriatus TaxID=3014554 RepID=UPI0022B57C82|nr:hypothetical protein [Cerasicoccus sp. TK19100]
MERLSIVILILIAAMGVTACKPKPEVKTYTIPKEQTAARPTMAAGAPADSPTIPAPGGATGPMMSGPMAGGGSMTATPGMVAQVSGFQTPAWQAPADWQAKDPGSVRKGSWDVVGAGGSADVSITVFPGDVGGDLANVNRWRQQLGLPAVDNAGLQPALTHKDFAGGHGHIVHLVGQNGQSILGAILPRGGATWFFKMQGDSALVESQLVPFDAFLETVDFSATETP